MASRNGIQLGRILFFLLALSSPAFSQCNTSDNPTCGKDKRFDALCCPYPNICYWADRQQNAACCPAGQTCLTGGQGGEPVSTITPVIKTTLSTIAQPESTTTYVQSPVTRTTAVIPVNPPTTTISTIQQSITTTTSPVPTTTPTTTVVTGGGPATSPAPGGGAYITGDGVLVTAEAPPTTSRATTLAIYLALLSTFAGVIT